MQTDDKTARDLIRVQESRLRLVVREVEITEHADGLVWQNSLRGWPAEIEYLCDDGVWRPIPIVFDLKVKHPPPRGAFAYDLPADVPEAPRQQGEFKP